MERKLFRSLPSVVSVLTITTARSNYLPDGMIVTPVKLFASKENEQKYLEKICRPFIQTNPELTPGHEGGPNRTQAHILELMELHGLDVMSWDEFREEMAKDEQREMGIMGNYLVRRDFDDIVLFPYALQSWLVMFGKVLGR